jgi:hypothetical protein
MIASVNSQTGTTGGSGSYHSSRHHSSSHHASHRKQTLGAISQAKRISTSIHSEHGVSSAALNDLAVKDPNSSNVEGVQNPDTAGSFFRQLFSRNFRAVLTRCVLNTLKNMTDSDEG